VLDRAKPGLIAVNSAGRRFVNEAASYHDFVEAMLESHKHIPSIPAYLICDAPFIKTHGLGLVYPGASNLSRLERTGYLFRGNTLDELAGKISVDAAALRETIARHNRFAEERVSTSIRQGRDRAQSLQRRPRPQAQSMHRPARDSAILCARCLAGGHRRQHGLSTDCDARVLGTDGKPIPGLYACGNDMASVMVGSYPGPGTTLGPAVVFAYRAAMHARYQDRAGTLC